MDIQTQTKEIAPSIAIFAIIVLAALAGSTIYGEYLDSNRETMLPEAIDFEETSEAAEIRREIRIIEMELELLSAEIIEGSGFGLWGLEQELNAIREGAIEELEL